MGVRRARRASLELSLGVPHTLPEGRDPLG
jgi:hypothetical protein